MHKQHKIAFIFIILLLSACQSMSNSTNSRQPNYNTTTPIQADTPIVSPTAEKTLLTKTPTIIPSKIPSQTYTEQLPSPTPTSTQLPDEYYIENMDGHRQYFKLGCEASAAVDWAAYYGVEINEYEFQYKLPVSDNPDIGFVGNVNDPWGQVPPYSYGVHANPVAKLLREYGLSAQAVKNFSIEQLKEQLANNNPAIVWVIGNCVGGIPYQYKDKNGDYVLVAAYEHVIIITGYNQETFRYVNNGKYYDIPSEVFLNSWGVLGNMAVIMELPVNNYDNKE